MGDQDVVHRFRNRDAALHAAGVRAFGDHPGRPRLDAGLGVGERRRVAEEILLGRETARRMRRRDLWDKILIATSLPLFAAYGQRGNPFGVNNLTLLISLLIWLVGDEIADTLFRSAEKSPYPLRDADIWSYIAPAGNLLAGWWLMDGQQHERFVVGLTSTSGSVGADGPVYRVTGATSRSSPHKNS
jgi:hypothetical protein